jgi:RNA polymerase sigma-70 factor (ECF subfamily)
MNEEQQILNALAAGDHEAFNWLFVKYFRKVKLFMMQLIKSEQDAEELAQDVFMKVWEYRERMPAVQSFNSYVYRMAKNRALNHLEHCYIEESYRENICEETNCSVEEEYYAKEMELLEQLIVSQMPAQRKKIYEMSRMEGLPNAEIATQLNISKKTVENHLNLALKEIRKALEIITLLFF